MFKRLGERAKLAANLAKLAVLLLVVSVGLSFGYEYVKSQIEVDVYRDRLKEVSEDFNDLQATYNEAVKKTAVTELVVRDGTVCVHVRKGDGDVTVIDTPFDPSHEIFVDYVVLKDRLWIRRVFDQRTKPEDGLIIDPQANGVDWKIPANAYGKTIYRGSLTDGRWVVTVTGDGSLALAKARDDAPADLQAAPPVKEYPQLEKEIHATMEEVGVFDVISRLFSSGSVARASADVSPGLSAGATSAQTGDE